MIIEYVISTFRPYTIAKNMRVRVRVRGPGVSARTDSEIKGSQFVKPQFHTKSDPDRDLLHLHQDYYRHLDSSLRSSPHHDP